MSSSATVLLLSLMVAVASADVFDLSCSCKTLPGGGFKYDLSMDVLSPTAPDNCYLWQWLSNGIVIAAMNDPSHNATNRSLTLESYLDHIHFSVDCPNGYFQANCTTNCRSQTPALVTLGVVVLLLAVGVVVWCLSPKFRGWIWTRTPACIRSRTPDCIRSRVCNTKPPPSSSLPESEKIPLGDISRTETV